MYCTLDLGSTKTEIALFGSNLLPLESTGFPTPFVRKEGVVFLDPESYAEEIIKHLAELLASADEKRPRGEDFFCTVTGMGSTILAVDRMGKVLVPCLSWEFRVPGGGIGEVPLSRTGKLVLPTYPLFKIPWILDRLGGKDALLLSLPDYVLARFIGFREIRTDFSFASRSLLFDDIACDWDGEILSAAGLRRENLPALAAAGTVLGEFDGFLKNRLGLTGEAFACAGMHDHVATGYLGKRLFPGRPYVVNPAGTTESVLTWSADRQRRRELVAAAPARGVNTESAWRKDELALVLYPTLSGKILDAARRFGVEPGDLFSGRPPALTVAPSRRRLVVEDPGLVIAADESRGTLDDFWRALVLGTQFEFLRALDDLEALTEKRFSDGALLFGGQAGDGALCRLKSAVSRRPVLAFPGVNGAALGAALAVAERRGEPFDAGPLLEVCRETTATDREIGLFQQQYERYRELCEAALRKERP